MLERIGIQTGIELDKLVNAIDVIAPMIARPIESGYYQLAKKSV